MCHKISLRKKSKSDRSFGAPLVFIGRAKCSYLGRLRLALQPVSNPYLVSAGRMQLRTYNGFTDRERVAGGVAQRRAAARGEFVFPSVCSICGRMSTKVETGSGARIVAHLEDYRRPLECLPCCRKCHHALHRRFSYPDPWLDLVKTHWVPGAWFTRLSMDVAKQSLPYDEIYPPARER